MLLDEERRASVRVPCSFTTVDKGKIKNISRTGAHLESRQDFEVDQRITLKFYLSPQKPLLIEGIICRKHKTPIESITGYGVAFDLKQDTTLLGDLTQFVERRLSSQGSSTLRELSIKSSLKEVVITGMGVLTSIGMNAQDYWKNLLSGKVGIKKVTDPFLKDSNYHLATIEEFDLQDFQDKQYYMRLRELKSARQKCFIGREVDLQLAAVNQSLQDAKLIYNRASNNIGVVLGFESPGFKWMEQGYLKLATYKKKHPTDSEETKVLHFFQDYMLSYINAYTFSHLFYTTSAFGFHGPSLSLNTASASGLTALHQSYKSIQTGEAEIMVAGASEDLNDSSLRYHAFHRLGVHSPDEKVLPWDIKRKGVVTGEAAISLILEEKHHALRRGAKIYGQLKASCINQDSYHIFSPSLDVKYLSETYEKSCKFANVSSEDVDLLLPHSTGTKLNDQIQTDAIRQSFPHGPYVTSFTPQVGHPLGASGLLRVVTGLLAMRDQVIPPTLATQNIDPRCAVKLVAEPTPARVRHVACSAISYGGTNVGMILSPPFQA